MRRFILEEAASTQDEAFRLLEAHPSVVVMARRQLYGRGRRGHRWVSEGGGLYVSFGWRGMESHRAMLLNLIAPVSITRLLSRFGIEGRIKLPNDILVKGKKISGILIEKRGDMTVLGIGLNVNQDKFPDDVHATSMKLVSGKEFPLEHVLELLEREIVRNMELPGEEIAGMFNRYLLTGTIRFRYRGREVEDTLERINSRLEAVGRKGRYLLPWMEDVRYLEGS